MDIININDQISGYNIDLSTRIVNPITRNFIYILIVRKSESFDLGNSEQLKHISFYDDFIESIIKLYNLKPTKSIMTTNNTIRVSVYMH
jgi:hypothetical protein